MNGSIWAPWLPIGSSLWPFPIPAVEISLGLKLFGSHGAAGFGWSKSTSPLAVPRHSVRWPGPRTHTGLCLERYMPRRAWKWELGCPENSISFWKRVLHHVSCVLRELGRLGREEWRFRPRGSEGQLSWPIQTAVRELKFRWFTNNRDQGVSSFQVKRIPFLVTGSHLTGCPNSTDAILK